MLGHPACPCVAVDHSVTTDVMLYSPLYGREPLPKRRLPADYGSGLCRPWDNSFSDSCGSADESWCHESWCYINETACRLSTIAIARSSYFPRRGGLFFSCALGPAAAQSCIPCGR